jgi:hypothetical protein
MNVTLSGIMIVVSPLQLKKALSHILITLLGIFVFWQPIFIMFVSVIIIPLQLSLESYLVFPDSTSMEVRELQPEKTPLPKLVTLLGIDIDLRALQLEKAQLPMFVTLLGIVIDLRALQP